MSESVALEAIAEVRAIDAFRKGFRAHPDQVNAPHSSDAEIVAIGPERWLALTTDALSSEISLGMYQDPYTAGWVLVMANLSDLAAVGARPLGLLNTLSLPPSWEGNVSARLSAGMADAAAAVGTYILGGDLNEAPAPVLSGSAVGWIEGAPLVTRVGVQAGDSLYATRAVGLGNAYATAFLMGHTTVARDIESVYRPVARLAEGLQLRPWVSAMMDGSDGLMTSLDQLARLNGVGWEIEFSSHLLNAQARRFMAGMNHPDWALLCGEHGDYELFFTVPENRQPAFEAACANWDWQPVRVGVASTTPGIRLHADGYAPFSFDGSFVRNLLTNCQGDWRAFVVAFWQYGQAQGLDKVILDTREAGS